MAYGENWPSALNYPSALVRAASPARISTPHCAPALSCALIFLRAGEQRGWCVGRAAGHERQRTGRALNGVGPYG